MPTFARLTGAILFGLLALYFAYSASPYFPEAQQPSYWYLLTGGVGVLCGWILVGTRAGAGYPSGIGAGITGGVAILFWVFFLMSFSDMIEKSLRKSYDGPIEAVINVFQLMVDWFMVFAVVELGVLMAVGSVVGGFITEFVGKRWS